jgi:hypothetical protein
VKHLRSFLESVGNNPSIEEVKSYFHNVIEDFCDQQSQDFTFEIYCNHYIENQVDPLDEIKWVQFKIKSYSTFDITDIYPVFKKLFDWSKFSGANLDKSFTKWYAHEDREEILYIDNYNKFNYTKVNYKRLYDPGNFDVVDFWEYTCTFYW